MLDAVNKNSKIALSVQVSEKLIEDIRSGRLKTGERMLSERQLAERFGISRGTVIEALNLLETQNYIERIPARGTFVADDVNHELSLVKIAFPFPENSILPTSLALENWAMASEAYRGMLEEAEKCNVEISFIHFKEAANDVQLARQFRRVENMDGCIFIGWQLSKLRQLMIEKGKYCVQISPSLESEPGEIIVTTDRISASKELAAFAKEKNYKKLKVISETVDFTNPNSLREKLRIMLGEFAQVGIETSPDWCYNVDSTKPEDTFRLFAENSFDLKNGSDIIFCSNTNIVPAVYRYCFDNGIKLGKDIGVFGHASGITFANMLPSLTYSKINHFEIGRRACSLCAEAIRQNRLHPHVELVKNTLIKGESV